MQHVSGPLFSIFAEVPHLKHPVRIIFLLQIQIFLAQRVKDNHRQMNFQKNPLKNPFRLLKTQRLQHISGQNLFTCGNFNCFEYTI